LVMRLPQTLHGQCPLTFYCRTFEAFSLSFSKENDAVDVFDSVRELTVASTFTICLLLRHPTDRRGSLGITIVRFLLHA